IKHIHKQMTGLASFGATSAFLTAYPKTGNCKRNRIRRTTMKTKLRNIAMTIGLTAVLGSATLVAEVKNKSIANIPFDFQVKTTTLPAGPYAVDYSPDSKLLVFRNLANGRSS